MAGVSVVSVQTAAVSDVSVHASPNISPVIVPLTATFADPDITNVPTGADADVIAAVASPSNA
jgi:hypothetical protein